MTRTEGVRRAMAAQVALHALELSVLTAADKARVAKAFAGLKALDEEQATFKTAVDDLCDEYSNPNAPSDDCARLIAELRTLLGHKPARAKKRGRS